MNEPIIRTHDVLLNAYWAANARRPESPCPYPSDSAAAHRWLEQYRDRVAQIAQQKTAA